MPSLMVEDCALKCVVAEMGGGLWGGLVGHDPLRIKGSALPVAWSLLMTWDGLRGVQEGNDAAPSAPARAA